MRNLKITCFFLSLFILAISSNAISQISWGGTPYGFKSVLKNSIEVFELSPPDYNQLNKEDEANGSLGLPERIGVSIPVNISATTNGTWNSVNSQINVWDLNIYVPGANGLTLYFSKFQIAPGDSVFIYSSDKTHLIGAFTDKNNNENGLFATEVVKGESIIIELIDNIASIDQSVIEISDVSVIYKPRSFNLNGIANSNRSISGNADECEVNIKCPEGDGWRNQANGIVKIEAKVGNSTYLCTGSIMNNTALDFAPYILTADHCGLSDITYASEADFALWLFYFNLESVSCEDDTPVTSKSLTGAIKISGSTPRGFDGSDFLLVKLKNSIPNSYNPFFQGWNAYNEISESGVSIHHPEGDVKKISTYTEPLELSQWGNVPETHLQVVWSETLNGHGVTEGGSSGSPLFNQSKQIIGTLTGGLSDCTSVYGTDQYGRFYYSWDRNGTNVTEKLQPWLDPLNTGLKVMEGSYNDKIAIAQFVADKTVIPVGSYVDFDDLSINNPYSWEWNFEGGTPGNSSLENPDIIYYDKLGSYDVLLVVTNEFGTDSVLLENYIKVVPVVYPNPTKNIVTILFGDDEMSHQLTITNSLGQLIGIFEITSDQQLVEFSFTDYPAGIYFIGIETNESFEYHKIIYSPN